jgi:hypothetical protein
VPPGLRVQADASPYPDHFSGRTYPSLPTGQHGRRPGRGEIQKKHVKDLAEFFGILDCAKRELEILR